MGNATSLTIGSLPKWDTSHAILCWPFVLDAGRLASPRVGRPFADRRRCQARASTRAAYRKLFGWPAWQAILSPRLPVEGVLGLTPPLYRLSLAPLSREARAIVTKFHRHSAWESSHSPIKSPENFWARGRMPDANAHKRPETHNNRRKRSDRSRPGRPTRRGSGRHQGTARMSGIEATSSYGGTEITDFRYA